MSPLMKSTDEAKRRKQIGRAILKLIRNQALTVDGIDEPHPRIFLSRPGRPRREVSVRAARPSNRGRHRQQRYMLELYFPELKTKTTLMFSRLLWMIDTASLIPHGWQVHHRDEDWKNNARSNLICLHVVDHDKVHKSDVPF